MAIYGALGEAPANATNSTRKGEIEANGVSVNTSGTSVVITLPYQVRVITNVLLTVNKATGLNTNAAFATVGNIGSGGGNAANQFTIFFWVAAGTAFTATANNPITVNWLAFGKLA